MLGWNETASLPLLPTLDSIDVFLQLRTSPQLNDISRPDGRLRPAIEFYPSKGDSLIDFDCKEPPPDGYWPIFTGGSFNLWTPDTGTYKGCGETGGIRQKLFNKRTNSAKLVAGVHNGFSEEHLTDIDTLPCNHARIAFRKISRKNDTVRVERH